MGLKELRNRLGMKQKELANKTGIDAPTLSKIENGKIEPTAEQETKIFEIVGEQKKNLTENAQVIVSLLENKWMTRRELAERLSCGDREVRKAITNARLNGYIICNDGDSCGYYLTNNINLVEKHYKTEYARAMTILASLKKSRQLLKEAGRI